VQEEYYVKDVTTKVQAKIYLESGEILILRIYSDAYYINKEEDNYHITVQPKHDVCKIYSITSEQLDEFLDKLEEENILFFNVIKGAKLDYKITNNIFLKIKRFFKNIFTK